MKLYAIPTLSKINPQIYIKSTCFPTTVRRFENNPTYQPNNIFNPQEDTTKRTVQKKFKPLENPPPKTLFPTHKGDPKNPQDVYEFEIPIHLLLRENELKYLPNSYLFESLTSITPKMRSTVIDWIIDVHRRLKMRTDTLFIIINFIDRYLSSQNLNNSKFQRLATAAIFLAAKVHENYAPSLHRLCALADYSFTELALSRMETSLVSILDFNLHPIPPSQFIFRFLQIVDADPKISFLSYFLLESTLFDPDLLGIRPSLLAASAVGLALLLELGPCSWTHAIEQEIGYSMHDLSPVIERIIKMVKAFPTSKLHALTRKYSGPQTMQVGLLKIPSNIKLY